MLLDWFQKNIGITNTNGFSIWLGKYQIFPHIHLWYSRNHSGFRSLLNFHIGYKKSQLAIWIVKYKERAMLPWHIDSNDPCYVSIIELKKSRSGGILEFENTRYKKFGRFYFFRGDRIQHRLTKIKKGTRWILMTQIGT